MNYIYATILVCFVIAVNGTPKFYYPRFVERYCANPKQQAIYQCMADQDTRIFEIAQNCVSAIKFGIKSFEEAAQFICLQMNQAELNFYMSCGYGALVLDYKRGSKMMSIIKACLRKYEPALGASFSKLSISNAEPILIL